MPVATGTMEVENGDNLSVNSRVLAGTGDWIPASAGMTDGGGTQAVYRGMTAGGQFLHISPTLNSYVQGSPRLISMEDVPCKSVVVEAILVVARPPHHPSDAVSPQNDVPPSATG